MSTPTTMALTVPKKTEEKNEIEVKASNALTVLLGKDRGIFYYMGQLEPDGSNFKSSTFTEIRGIIAEKRLEVMKRHQHEGEACEKLQKAAEKKGDPEWQKACFDKDFVVVIKPNTEATYGSTIDILDEMSINGVKAFAVVEITEQENSLVKLTEQNSERK